MDKINKIIETCRSMNSTECLYECPYAHFECVKLYPDLVTVPTGWTPEMVARAIAKLSPYEEDHNQ